MNKTNTGLVEHAKKIHRQGAGYVWGTFCQVLTEASLRQKIRQYPRGVGRYEGFIRTNYLNKITCDCAGLIKGYVFKNANGEIRYNPKYDLNADMMYSRSTRKGKVSTIPDTPGLGVWRKGHIGVYIGGGYVIEARSTKLGVKKYKLSDRNFTHWLEIPHISYSNQPQPKPQPKPIKIGTDITKINIDSRDIAVRTIHEEQEGLTQYIAIRDLECLGYQVDWVSGSTNIKKNNIYRTPNLNLDFILDNVRKENIDIAYEGKQIKLNGYTTKNNYNDNKMQFMKIRDLQEFGYDINWDNNSQSVIAKKTS